MKHQQDHGSISPEMQRIEELVYLLITYGARNPLDCLYTHRTPNWALLAGSPYERLMSFRDPCVSWISHLLDRVLSGDELSREDQIFIEGRYSRQDTVDGRGRKVERRLIILSGTEREP
jgi:hypothetical protein